jgi:hypothetical protein
MGDTKILDCKFKNTNKGMGINNDYGIFLKEYLKKQCPAVRDHWKGIKMGINNAHGRRGNVQP